MPAQKIQSSNGDTVAIIVEDTSPKDGPNFISQTNYPLQVAISVYKKGHKIQAHAHRKDKTTNQTIQELIFIKQGKIAVTLYDEKRTIISTFNMAAGDFILLIGGGHGFDILEDTIILEVKQGPYPGREKDKVIFE